MSKPIYIFLRMGHFILLQPKAPIIVTIQKVRQPRNCPEILSSVQSLSRVRLLATPWTAAHQASLSITNSQSPPKPMSIESMMPSNHLVLHRPLLLPSVFPSISLFQWGSSLHQVARVLDLQLQHQSFQWISFRIDWFDLLAVQETLKNLLQHNSSKASILLCSAFFMV